MTEFNKQHDATMLMNKWNSVFNTTFYKDRVISNF